MKESLTIINPFKSHSQQLRTLLSHNTMKLTTEQIQNWESEYLAMKNVKLSERQREILKGSELKSNEGMLFGQMYANWKEIKFNEE